MAIYSHFFSLLPRFKKHYLLILFKWPKKSDKSDQQAARVSQRIPEIWAEAWLSGLWAPGRRLFTHALASGKVKDGSWPVRTGKRQVGQFEQAKGKKEVCKSNRKRKEEGSNTPVGRWPGE